MSSTVDELHLANSSSIPEVAQEVGVEAAIDAPYPSHDDLHNETNDDTNDSGYYSDSDSDDSLDSDLAYINAQLQWEESVNQLKGLVALVILPLIGKVIGRRMAGVIWRRVLDLWW